MLTIWTRNNEDVEYEKSSIPWNEALVHGDQLIPRRRRLRVALFDLDGTLIDTESQYTRFWREIAHKYRPDVPQLEQLIKGTTLTHIFATYFTDPQCQSEIREALVVWEQQMNYTFYPGALDFIADLRRHDVRCAIVTSSDRKKISMVRRQVPMFDRLFDKVLTAEDFVASKPAPDCYLLGARTFGADIDECVVFEDAYTGLQAGMSSGIFTIGLPTSLSPEAIAGQCHYVLPSFENMTYERLEALLPLSL